MVIAAIVSGTFLAAAVLMFVLAAVVSIAAGVVSIAAGVVSIAAAAAFRAINENGIVSNRFK